MKLSVLGRTQIDGHDIGSRRVRQLAAALVLHRDQIVSVDRLAELIWGDAQPDDPTASLHTLVSRLRAMLPAGLSVDAVGGGYRLSVPAGSVDLDVMSTWRDRTRAIDPTDALLAIDAVLALVRGEAFADLDDVAVLAPRARADDDRWAACEERASLLLQLGRDDDAVAALREVIAERPDRESAVAMLMEALYRAGRQPEALAVFGALRDHLRDEFGMSPTTRLSALETAILRQEVPLTPSAPSRRRRSIALPTSSFVGRVDDVDGLAALAHRVRMVSVLGPGGMGKTRVAMQLAARFEAAGQRVALAELAEVGEDDELAAVVAAMIGASTERATSADDVLRDHFGDDPWVLVIDNCEHLVVAARELVGRLLGACRGLVVIATSREPLGVDGEHRWVLHGLDASDAVRLFMDRALAHDPAFDHDPVSSLESAAVARLCARLDGVPLAIELAAAALPFTGLAELEAGLDDRFALLRHNRSGAPVRHQSLEAVLAWSFDRLDPGERDAFCRLGVFAGSFTIDDVRQLHGASTAALVPRLVERSLVARVASTGATSTSTVRFELLETMRVFARLHRGDALERDAAAYARWALDFVRDAVEQLHGAHDVESSRLVRLQMPACRHAYRWFSAHGDDAERVALVSALVVWGWQCDHGEVMAWAFDTIAEVTSDDPDVVTGAAAAAAVAGSRTLDLDTAERHAALACAASEHASPGVAALAHYAAAEVAIFRGRQTAAASFGAAAHRLAAGTSPGLEFFGAIDAALGHLYAGEFDDADRWTGIADEIATRLGGVNCPGWVEYVRGDRWVGPAPRRALVHLSRCLDLIDPVEQSFLTAVAGLVRVTTAGRIGEVRGRGETFRELFARWQDGGSQVQMLNALREVVPLLVDDGRVPDAAVILGAVLAVSPDPHHHLAVLMEEHAILERGLSPDEMEAALAEGAALGLDAAIERAVSLVEGPTDA